jgi:shikimate kinase
MWQFALWPFSMFTGQANLLLIGLRCAGKSTIAPRVAAQAGMGFVDLDDRTAVELGATTAGEALRSLGEPAFRAGELHALVKVLTTRHQVVALGGGTPMYRDSLEVILHERNSGRAGIVYLRAPAAVLAERLRRTGGASRPALTGDGTGDPADEVADLFAHRDPVYQRLAHRVIEVERLSADDAATAIGAWWAAQRRGQ